MQDQGRIFIPCSNTRRKGQVYWKEQLKHGPWFKHVYFEPIYAGTLLCLCFIVFFFGCVCFIVCRQFVGRGAVRICVLCAISLLCTLCVITLISPYSVYLSFSLLTILTCQSFVISHSQLLAINLSPSACTYSVSYVHYFLGTFYGCEVLAGLTQFEDKKSKMSQKGLFKQKEGCCGRTTYKNLYSK